MSDAIEGLLWNSDEVKHVRREIVRGMPPIPETGWRPPPEYPNLSRADVIAVDLETWDPELKQNGPGWARGVGHIAGAAIGTKDGCRWYFPMRHTVQPEDNLDPDHTLVWLRDTLGNPAQAKIGANLMYDLGWLRQEGVNVAGELHDIQFAEALLIERGQVDLETLGERYLGMGKQSNAMYEWCAAYYGGKPTGTHQGGNIHRCPPRLVGPYAMSDVDLPLRIFPHQLTQLLKQGLYALYRMECELIPLLLDMRFAGVAVDLDEAERVSDRLLDLEITKQNELNQLRGVDINVNSNDSLADLFDHLGLEYPFTEKGKPSFKKDFLDDVEHPVGELIRTVRNAQKLRNTFINGYIKGSNINGKIYGSFHPLRGNEGGTRSGRFSSSHPNLQNIPSRDPVWAPILRGMFVPDPGHARWVSMDYAQIEYRLLVHYARGQAGMGARRAFEQNPDMDYHKFVQDLIFERTGKRIPRKPLKNINFGLIYGMGQAKLARSLGMDKNQAKAMFDAYFKAIPFARDTMEYYTTFAKEHGYVKTILGRRSRFDVWVPRKDKYADALPLGLARAAYGYDIERAFTHKALNRVLQGSAADLMKLAMLEAYKAGAFKVTGTPRLTVHDELNWSDPGGVDTGFEVVRHIMEQCLGSLNVPVRTSAEYGPDWGHLTEAHSCRLNGTIATQQLSRDLERIVSHHAF